MTIAEMRLKLEMEYLDVFTVGSHPAKMARGRRLMTRFADAIGCDFDDAVTLIISQEQI